MKKIAGLYRSFLNEQDEQFQEYRTGGEKLEELQKFLKCKLNAEDYFIAEEMLNELMSATEEKGFTAGCKYISGVAKELFAE